MESENFFAVLPDNFFNLFSGSYKRPAAECLTLLYQKTCNGLSFSLEKEYVIVLMEDYFESTHQDIEDENRNILNAHDSALYLLRRFRDCGWVEEELGEDYQYFIHLQDYAVEIIKTLSSLNQQSSVEYSGYIYLIYSMLNSFQLNNGAVTLEQIYRNTEELFRKLSNLNTNIKKYIQRLLEDENKNNLLALMNMLLEEYQTKIVDRAYYNLTTKDHPAKYKQSIIDRLNYLRNHNDTIDELSRQYTERKDMEYQDAYETVVHQMDYICDSFEYIDDIMKEIDRKNNKYVSSALSRITYLLDAHEDMEGKLNRMINAVAEYHISSDEIFSLSEITNLSADSLFTAKKVSRKFINTVLQKADLEDEVVQYFREKYKREQRFSKKSVCEYINSILKERSVVKASDLDLVTADQFTYLILIYMYGYSSHVTFEIEELDSRIERGPYRFKNFIIRRKS